MYQQFAQTVRKGGVAHHLLPCHTLVAVTDTVGGYLVGFVGGGNFVTPFSYGTLVGHPPSLPVQGEFLERLAEDDNNRDYDGVILYVSREALPVLRGILDALDEPTRQSHPPEPEVLL